MGIEAALMFQAAGMGMQAVSAYGNSKASKQAYEAQAQVNRNNAQIAQWQAEDALARGDKAAAVVRMRGAQTKGSQRARMAANGVDLGAGSALEILTDTDYFTGVDIATTKDNAAREAWALRNQANGFTSEASLMQGAADRQSPMLAAGTSLLTSAGKVAGSWYAASGGGGRKVVPDYPGAEY